MSLFKSVCVYRRRGDEVVVYRCFERLNDGMIFVQSADRVRRPIAYEDLRRNEVQFWELLLDGTPEERSPGCRTVEEAIAAFDADFA